MKFNLGNTNVLRIGYSHYTSLPIKWVKDIGVHKGSKLKVSMDEKKRLILEPVEMEI